jgi:hypothetical protein
MARWHFAWMGQGGSWRDAAAEAEGSGQRARALASADETRVRARHRLNSSEVAGSGDAREVGLTSGQHEEDRDDSVLERMSAWDRWVPLRRTASSGLA